MKTLLRNLCPPVVWKALGSLKKTEQTADSRKNSELDRLYHLGRNTATTTWLLPPEFQVPDPWSFSSMFNSYFEKENYRFQSATESPLIIDGGANIGVGVRYWKKLYPESRVIAFEADPQIYQVLTENCRGLSHVDLRQEALWVDNTPLTFAAVGADGGHLDSLGNDHNSENSITVPARRLRDLLIEPVDLLKLDIEGAEIRVIEDCADRLHLVKFLFVEHHSFMGMPQCLGQFFSTLEQAGFRLHVDINKSAKQPFVDRPVSNQKDLRLNIYCFRE